MVTPSSISVKVPPFLDADQFIIISGSVSVSIVQEQFDGKIVFGPSSLLTIADLPQTGLSPETVTLGACRINAQLAAASILLVLFLALFRYIATAMRLKRAENMPQKLKASLQSD